MGVCGLAIKGLNKRKSCRPIFKQLKVITVTTLHIFEVLCYIKNNYLWRNLDMYKYNRGRKCDIHVPSCNTSLFKTSVINMGIRMYYKIPTKTKQLESFRDFKRRLKLFYWIILFIHWVGFFFYILRRQENQ